MKKKQAKTAIEKRRNRLTRSERKKAAIQAAENTPEFFKLTFLSRRTNILFMIVKLVIIG